MSEQYQVVPRRVATQDLRDAMTHYAAEADAVAARRFIDAAEQAFALIKRQPGTGSPRDAVDLDWPGLPTHPVQRFPYLIFYLEQTGRLDDPRTGRLNHGTDPARWVYQRGGPRREGPPRHPRRSTVGLTPQ